MPPLKAILTTALLVTLPIEAIAQEHNAHHEGMDATPMLAMPNEPGQGAFAAIAEIVALLSADPSTDWSNVNIDVLRDHLVDMNLLTLNAAVETKLSGNEVQFSISGVDRTYDAIRAMVPAHARELSSMTDWDVKAELTDTGAMLSLSSQDAQEISKITALGFFGVMATGSHHQMHHLMIAKNEGMH